MHQGLYRGSKSPQSSYHVLENFAGTFYPKQGREERILANLRISTERNLAPTMSIKGKSVAIGVAEPLPTTVAPLSHKRWYTVFLSPLWLCLLVALLIRLWLTYHTHGVIDGDEAMVGIQAEHILHGEHPIYFYGQPYMGSLEAYLMAILFAIAGPSVWMLRAEPILLSLLVVWLTWKFAGALADAAQLPPFASLMFKTVASLFAALPPLYDTVLELRTLGGYIETFVLMLLLLLSAYQLTRRWHEGATKKELALRWTGIGFIVGLGLWVNPLIAPAVAAAAIWIIVFCIVEPIQLQQQQRRQEGQLRGPVVFFQEFLLALLSIPACIVGLIPALRWGSRYQWANFTYVLQLNDMKSLSVVLQPYYHNRLALIHAEVSLYEHYVAPRVISGALPVESQLITAIHSFTLEFGLLCIAATALLVMLSLVWHHPVLLRMRQLVVLPLLFALSSAIMFCTSIASSAGLVSFQNDIAGRYATPLMLALPFFFAMTLTLLSMALYNLFMRGGAQRHAQARQQEAPQLASRPVIKTANFFMSISAQVLIGLLLLSYLGVQVYTYVLTDPDATYQSPSCPIAPAYDDGIITYLQQQHVHYAWAITWVGNPITFKTNSSIITADPRFPLAHNGLGRIPDYTEDVLHADRPAMLAIIRSNDPAPILLKTLDALHVTYSTARFPSEPGYQVLVVTAMSRTVSIFESKGFGAAFPGCI